MLLEMFYSYIYSLVFQMFLSSELKTYCLWAAQKCVWVAGVVVFAIRIGVPLGGVCILEVSPRGRGLLPACSSPSSLYDPPGTESVLLQHLQFDHNRL